MSVAYGFGKSLEMFPNVCWQAQFYLLDAFTGELVTFKMLHQLRIFFKVNQRRDAYRHKNNTFIEVFQRVFQSDRKYDLLFYIPYGFCNTVHFQIQFYHDAFDVQCKFSTALSCLDTHFMPNNHCNPSHLGQRSKIILKGKQNNSNKHLARKKMYEQKKKSKFKQNIEFLMKVVSYIL